MDKETIGPFPKWKEPGKPPEGYLYIEDELVGTSFSLGINYVRIIIKNEETGLYYKGVYEEGNKSNDLNEITLFLTKPIEVTKIEWQ